ncbi:MAG: zinc metallopeptidase [Candidatus Dojkabacteria bacterium]|jgi:Zn-dependent membrane protease YugP
MYFDPIYYIYIIPGILLALIAQLWITTSFNRNRSIPTGKNITGVEVAQIIKDGESFSVDVEVGGAALTDHFDPTKDLVHISSLSKEDSVASVAVVAHEFGHVEQKFSNSLFFNMRLGLVPIVNIGSRLGYILIIVGLILNMLNLAEIGLMLFALTTVFALITIPIEIDASKRAMRFIKKYNLIDKSRMGRARDILLAAATTYVAALLASLLNILYYASLIRRRD